MRAVFALLFLLFTHSLAFATDFTASQSGPARDQPDGPRTVGTVEQGRSYPLLKRGGPGAKWCKLGLPTGPAWVLCSEGSLSDQGTTPVRPGQTKSASAQSPSQQPAALPNQGSTTLSFDYYLLSLSWSPSFCASKGASSPEQCGLDKRYGFVVHGLWPQAENGDNPMSCSLSVKPSPELADRMMDVMPSHHLIEHEWQKHGTCSGLSPEEYFANLRSTFQNVRIPKTLQRPVQPVRLSSDDIKSQFVESNPGLTKEMFTVHCRNVFSEIRFCLDKQLRFRACGKRVRDACAGMTVFPPLR